MTIGFVGAGSWGTTLAVHVARLGYEVLLWGHGERQRELLESDRENREYLPGIEFPPTITVVESPSESCSADIVVLATPTQFIRSTLSNLPSGCLSDRIIVSVSKGIEEGSLLRISQMVELEHGVSAERFVALSGPSHAEEVSRGIPTLVVSACPSLAVAQAVQQIFMTESLRVYVSEDLVGVELGGALKNVIALAAGIIDGLEMGDNTKAALITRGLAEMSRVGAAFGAQPHTFSGLSGLGDLVVTCTSRHSRNRLVGERIGRGRRLVDVIDEMRMVAEGVSTCRSAHALASRAGTEAPIIHEVFNVLFEEKKPREAIIDLMTRESTHEFWN